MSGKFPEVRRGTLAVPQFHPANRKALPSVPGADPLYTVSVLPFAARLRRSDKSEFHNGDCQGYCQYGDQSSHIAQNKPAAEPFRRLKATRTVITLYARAASQARLPFAMA